MFDNLPKEALHFLLGAVISLYAMSSVEFILNQKRDNQNVDAIVSCLVFFLLNNNTMPSLSTRQKYMKTQNGKHKTTMATSLSRDPKNMKGLHICMRRIVMAGNKNPSRVSTVCASKCFMSYKGKGIVVKWRLGSAHGSYRYANVDKSTEICICINSSLVRISALRRALRLLGSASSWQRRESLVEAGAVDKLAVKAIATTAAPSSTRRRVDIARLWRRRRASATKTTGRKVGVAIGALLGRERSVSDGARFSAFLDHRQYRVRVCATWGWYAGRDLALGNLAFLVLVLVCPECAPQGFLDNWVRFWRSRATHVRRCWR